MTSDWHYGTSDDPIPDGYDAAVVPALGQQMSETPGTTQHWLIDVVAIDWSCADMCSGPYRFGLNISFRTESVMQHM